MTDVLGVCESWAGGEAVIRTADGAAVTIPITLIVSGKPVPPRPSTRHRVSVRNAESHAAPLWTGIIREQLGDWELRTEPAPVDRLRKRTNSCLAVGDPGVDFAAAEEHVLSFYRQRDRDAVVQVEVDSEIDHAFVTAGWTPVAGDALFLIASVARARRRLGSDQASAQEGAEMAIDGPRFVASTTGGTGRAAIDGDWLGIHDLYVEPDRRRTGLGSQLLRDLLEIGAEHGATTAWLHVETENEPARMLYEAIGFEEHHACRYLAPPATRSTSA